MTHREESIKEMTTEEYVAAVAQVREALASVDGPVSMTADDGTEIKVSTGATS